MWFQIVFSGSSETNLRSNARRTMVSNIFFFSFSRTDRDRREFSVRFRAFDVELLYIAEKLNIPLGEVAVNWQEIPGSKLDPFAASFQMGVDILAVWLRYFFGFWKIRSQMN